MVRKLTQPWLRLTLGVALPLAGSLVLADDFDYSADESSPAVTSAAEPGLIPTPTSEPTLAPVANNAAASNAAETDSDSESTDAKSDSQPVHTEIIRERFPSSAVKVERHVAQDTDGNYYNHGIYTQFDEKGRVIGTGEYKDGKKQGKWTRWYATSEGPMFQGPMFKEFQAPFISEVTFVDDKMNGLWKVFDAKNRKASEWEFTAGKPHGKSVWHYANGRIRREIVYKEGEIDGEVQEWNAEGKIINKDKYINGRRLAVQTDLFAPGQKRAEGWTLFARDVTKPNYNWWDGITTVTVTGKDGVNQRHGDWAWWHKNGQKQMEGKYVEDAPVGKFAWWYSNGQKQLEGEYIEGKQHGKFVWWHENGQKQLEGIYEHGTQIGKWTRWKDDGKVAEVGDFGAEGRPKTKLTKDDSQPEDLSTPDLQAVQPEPASPRFKR